jgi:hypothetical protein
VADRRLDDEELTVLDLLLYCFVGGLGVGLMGALTIGRG